MISMWVSPTGGYADGRDGNIVTYEPVLIPANGECYSGEYTYSGVVNCTKVRCWLALDADVSCDRVEVYYDGDWHILSGGGGGQWVELLLPVAKTVTNCRMHFVNSYGEAEYGYVNEIQFWKVVS
jgi:hypothetical protein